MTIQGLTGLLDTLRDLGRSFEDASTQLPPLLHELLVAQYLRTESGWWERFLSDSYYPRLVLSPDGQFFRAAFPISDWGEERAEAFPDGQRCSRFYGDATGLAEFNRLAGHGYELMRAIASRTGATSTALGDAVRNPGFRLVGYPPNGIARPAPSEAKFPFDERMKFGWLDLVYQTARLYPDTCQVRTHMFGDLTEEKRDHHHSPDVYSREAFATEFNIEVLGSIELDIFALSATAVELWLAPPRPVEVVPPRPINLWELAHAASPQQADAEPPLDPAITSPTWDADARELRWGRVVLKTFSKPAENQTTILSTFEDDGWPAVIDDPLPGSKAEPIKRLGDTLYALNKDMLRPGVIVFQRYKSGKAIRWRRKL